METQDRTIARIDREADALTIDRPSPRTVLTTLVAVLGTLVVIDAIAFLSGWEPGRRISMTGAVTPATWWASVQLLLLAVVLSLAAAREFGSGRRSAALTLGAGALTAVAWSIDKTAALREMATDTSTISGLVAVTAAFVVIALMLPGTMSLLRTDRRNMLLAAIGVAINLSGRTFIEALSPGKNHFVMVAEESVEFLGIAIIVWAVYRMLGTTEFRFRRV